MKIYHWKEQHCEQLIQIVFLLMNFSKPKFLHEWNNSRKMGPRVTNHEKLQTILSSLLFYLNKTWLLHLKKIKETYLSFSLFLSRSSSLLSFLFLKANSSFLCSIFANLSLSFLRPFIATLMRSHVASGCWTACPLQGSCKDWQHRARLVQVAWQVGE